MLERLIFCAYASGISFAQDAAFEPCFRKLGWEPPVSHVTVSPDGKWAVVDPEPRKSTGRTVPLSSFHLVDLSSCTVIPEFRRIRFHHPGRFTADSREYQLYNPSILVNEKPFNMGRAFVLRDREWTTRQLP